MSVTQEQIDEAMHRMFGSVPQADWRMASVTDPGGNSHDFKEATCFTIDGLVNAVESMIREHHDGDTNADHGIIWRARPHMIENATSGESHIYLRLAIVPSATARYVAAVYAATEAWKAETGWPPKSLWESYTFKNNKVLTTTTGVTIG